MARQDPWRSRAWQVSVRSTVPRHRHSYAPGSRTAEITWHNPLDPELLRSTKYVLLLLDQQRKDGAAEGVNALESLLQALIIVCNIASANINAGGAQLFCRRF